MRAPLCPDGAFDASCSGNAQGVCVAPERSGGGDAQSLGTGPSLDDLFDFFMDALWLEGTHVLTIAPAHGSQMLFAVEGTGPPPAAGPSVGVTVVLRVCCTS